MPIARRSRAEVVALIADVFRAHGYDGSSLRLISEATGLGRASLYHYFPDGKEQMGREVFAHIGTHAKQHLLDPLRTDGSPEQRLGAWTKGVDRFYRSGRNNCLLGSMVLSGGADRYSREIAATFRSLIGALTDVLQDAGLPAAVARRRATGAVASVQGALVTARGLNNTRVFRDTLRDLPGWLLRPTGEEHGERR